MDQTIDRVFLQMKRRQRSRFMLYHGNVYSSQPYSDVSSAVFAQARLRPAEALYKKIAKREQEGGDVCEGCRGGGETWCFN
jgi:hypothetical protein